MSDLVKRLRIKAGMIEMGELIAWGSDSALMREAADALEMAVPAAQGEPVAWRYRMLSEDWEKTATIHPSTFHPDHKDLIIEPLYTAPQPDAAPAAHGPLFLSDEKILEIASNPMVTPCSPWWLKNDVKSGDVQNSAIAFARAVLKAAAPIQGEPVGWQFYQDGKWWYGDDRIKLHRKNTEAAGMLVRDVYAAPQPAEQQPAPDVAGLVEIAKEIVDLHDKRGVVLTVHVEALREALAAHRQQGGEA